ncbi:MAG: helix-turn-helix domain-containing protein [Myxococcota bacterium]
MSIELTAPPIAQPCLDDVSPMHHAALDVLDALRAWQRATSQDRRRDARRHMTCLLGALDVVLTAHCPRHAPEHSVLLTSLLEELPEFIAKRVRLELDTMERPALLVDLEHPAWRAPAGGPWLDMSKRRTPFRLLATLLRQRLEHPGQPLDAHKLCDAVWPDEIILPEAATNRLYVTIATLRRQGLRDVLRSGHGGYLLDPSVRVAFV